MNENPVTWAFEALCKRTLARAGGGELELRRYPTESGAVTCELWLMQPKGRAEQVAEVPRDLPRREAVRAVERANGRPVGVALPVAEEGVLTAVRRVVGPEIGPDAF